jgi:hypothetical protein
MAIAIVTATNADYFAGNAHRLDLTGAYLASVTSGDLIVGDGTSLASTFVGVAEADYVDATTPIAVRLECCKKLPVTAKNSGGANVAVLPGTKLYYDSGNTRIDVGVGTFVGYALEGIVAGATGTIGVQVCERASEPTVASDTTYDTWNFGRFELVNIANNDLILDGWVPGYAGSIEAVWFHPIVAASTADKDIDLAFTIGGTQTTGGLMTLLTATVTEGDVIAGTAITAANTFIATDEINIKCVQATAAFAEGSGNVIARVSFAHDHA